MNKHNLMMTKSNKDLVWLEFFILTFIFFSTKCSYRVYGVSRDTARAHVLIISTYDYIYNR